MLPSFRLIAATFLCGFFVVFAGLRLAASLNDIHEGAPVMAAHAAPVSIAPAADRDLRRGLAAVPVMYDLRFAVSPVAPTLIRVAPTVFDRPAPPLAIVPPEDVAEPAQDPPQPESTVAAIPPDALPVEAAEAPAIVDAPAATPAEPQPAAAPESTPPQAPQTLAPQTLTTDPAPEVPAAAEAAPADPVPAVKTAAIEPQASPEPETAVAEPDTTASVVAPDEDVKTAVRMPVAKPRAAKPAAKSAPKAIAKVVLKKRVRTAHRAAPANNPFGANGASNSFGSQQH
jgi:hypothetical protein